MRPIRRRPLRERMAIADKMVNDLDRFVAYRVMCEEMVELLEELRDSYRDLHQDREHERDCYGCDCLLRADMLLDGG